MEIVNLLFIQGLASIFSICAVANDGPLCYSCDRIPRQRDCNTIVQCGPHEKCYGEHYVTSGGVQMFRSGCKDSSSCSQKKRSDFTLCKSCCSGNYCNIQTCDVPIKLGKRCLACDDVIDPHMCTRDILCDDDQICYTEEIYNANKEKRYRLGCAEKTSCGYVVAPQVGRRHVLTQSDSRVTSSYCGQCCDTAQNCNRELCRTGALGYDLILPPPLQYCYDYDTSQCSSLIGADPLSCDDRTVRFLICPRSCGVCSGAGGIPGIQTTTAVLPSTTAPPSGQCPSTFELQRCQVIDCAIGVCTDSRLRPLCHAYCSGSCLPVDCSNTKFANT